MSGKLILKNEGGWRACLLPALLSALASGAILWLAMPLLERWHMTALVRQVTACILALVLWWTLYPRLFHLLGKRDPVRAVSWTLTEDTLTVGETAIPRSQIKMVHCWPNRSALGTADTGWTVNIETTGKNLVLRSATEGAETERSAQLLRELVCALGFETRWKD